METPEKIYLQWPDQEPPEGSSELDPVYITWCQDRIETSDVEYIRKDLFDALRADAERYRWLRDQEFSGPEMQCLLVYQGASDHSLLHDELDDAIDAQMKTKGVG